MLDRRHFMRTCSAMGFTGTLFPGVLWAQAESQHAGEITKEMIDNAAAIAGVPIPDEYKEMMLNNLNRQVRGYDEIYRLHISNSVAPALLFDPVLPGMTFQTARKAPRISAAPHITVPESLDDLAFASVRDLAELVRTKKGLLANPGKNVLTTSEEIQSHAAIRRNAD